ncbi:glycosyltransferase, group 1 family protein [Leptospira ryugenii]|uniref:Glycosyltransferase, group 1 family protein n=1 Tax=Leptospira ryugenii TaxID=1917863 RepID=A0A2P2E501_9LEPT|nr:glycosyltransferase, group 1 family protein [Leptospira ryugenii]
MPKDYFLTIGTLEPRKNIKRLVEAFQQFRGLFPNSHFKLLVLGRKGWGTEGEDLYQYLHSDQAKQDSIHFFESPEEEFLREAIQKCKVFFFPSLHEGFGLPLLEAMIENKKCVASNIPVFREILETGNDLYVDANDTNAWRDAFVTVSKYKSFTRNPKFNPKIWSWDATAKLLEKEIFQNEMV